MFNSSKAYHGGQNHGGGHPNTGSTHQHNDEHGHNHGHEHKEGEPCCSDTFIYINGQRFDLCEGLTIHIGNNKLVFSHCHPDENVKDSLIDHKGYTIKIQTPKEKGPHQEAYPKLFINEEEVHVIFNPQLQTFSHHAFFREFDTLEELAKFYISQFPQIKIHNH